MERKVYSIDEVGPFVQYWPLPRRRRSTIQYTLDQLERKPKEKTFQPESPIYAARIARAIEKDLETFKRPGRTLKETLQDRQREALRLVKTLHRGAFWIRATQLGENRASKITNDRTLAIGGISLEKMTGLTLALGILADQNFKFTTPWHLHNLFRLGAQRVDFRMVDGKECLVVDFPAPAEIQSQHGEYMSACMVFNLGPNAYFDREVLYIHPKHADCSTIKPADSLKTLFQPRKIK